MKVGLIRWHFPPDAGFETRRLEIRSRGFHESLNFYECPGKKQFGFENVNAWADDKPSNFGMTWILRDHCTKAPILLQVTIYRRLRIGRDGHLDQSEAYDMS